MYLSRPIHIKIQDRKTFMDQKLKLVDYQFLVHSALSMRASEGTVRKPPNRFHKGRKAS